MNISMKSAQQWAGANAAAAQGLPVTLDELAAFFADDLHDFGIGEVSREGIRKAAEWFAYTYPAWRAAQ